jgi:YD repeat-containing protein
MGTDTLGLIDRVEGPMGRVTQLHRNGAGWLERIEDSVHGTVALGYDSEGRLGEVTDVVGRVTRFEWDASGWLKAITRPDGDMLSIVRNPAGEVVRLRFGDDVWGIERSPDGWPRVMGDHRWERDINGRVRTLSGPLGSLRFTRDPAGWLRSASAEDWTLEISRDANGWPVGWSGTDGQIEVSRDGAGRVVTETGPYQTRVLRDPRGAPVRIVAGALGEWRTQRDAAGRVLTVKGPQGVALSVERDLSGRPKWVRFPDGSILRRSVDGGVTDDVLVGSSGGMAGDLQLKRDADGRLESRTVAGGSWQYQRNAVGDLLAITGEAGTGWTFLSDRALDPEGRLQLYDAAGWLIEAQLAVGVPAWGVGGSLLSLMRDDTGRLTGLSGESGVSPVRFDSLGRLVGYRPPDGAGHGVRFDARGRPAALSSVGGAERTLLWKPDADPAAGVVGLLATGVEAATPWVFVEGGMAARRNGMEVESLVADGRGDPVWLLDGAGSAAALVHDVAGMPGQVGTDIVGAGARLQWFEGGPIQVGGVVIDPVSGQRVDGVSAWPWAVRGPRAVLAAHPSDPGPWSPESAWSDPLHILEAMGVIQPAVGEVWTTISQMPRAHFGIPESLDGGAPPLGPDREDLPLGEVDPLTEALVRAVLPGGGGLGPLSPAAALVGAEITLPWLPPGWEVPGLESWRQAGAWSQD